MYFFNVFIVDIRQGALALAGLYNADVPHWFNTNSHMHFVPSIIFKSPQRYPYDFRYFSRVQFLTLWRKRHVYGHFHWLVTGGKPRVSHCDQGLYWWRCMSCNSSLDWAINPISTTLTIFSISWSSMDFPSMSASPSSSSSKNLEPQGTWWTSTKELRCHRQNLCFWGCLT